MSTVQAPSRAASWGRSIPQLATNRLEDEERKRRFLRGVAVKEVQEDRFETFDV